MTQERRGVLLIGAGRMGAAMLKGWLSARNFPAIYVVEPFSSDLLKAQAAQGAIHLAASFEEAALPPLDAAVLAVKPQMLAGAEGVDLLKSVAKTGALVLSIAAGVSTGFLKRNLGDRARVVRAMPNTPGAIGQGVTALYAADLSEKDRALAEALTQSLGETLWVDDEALMDAVTALSGSGPAYVFLLAEALAAAGEAEGLPPETAARLARLTVSGAGALLAASTQSPASLRQEVTSPGGTTAAALKVLMAEDGLVSLLRRAMREAAQRSRDLGKG